MYTLVELLIFGISQGIFEWLPISSEGVIFLINSFFFDIASIENLIKFALFLHLGTFFAALFYFRNLVVKLIRSLFNYKTAKVIDRKILNFLIISTIVTSLTGLLMLQLLINLEEQLILTSQIIIFGVAFLLFFTAFIQIKAKKRGIRTYKNLEFTDSLFLGIMQGFAVLPGLSRSGLTVASLLLRKIDKTQALKLSFLMSLPIVLAGNILFNLSFLTFSLPMLFALMLSFIFGILTIHVLIKFSEKINFGYFVLIFAILTATAGFLIF